MKKLFFASAVILLFGSASFCQTKGKVGLDFMVRNELSINFYNLQTTFIPIIGIRYFPVENLGLRGRLSYVSTTNEQANYYNNPRRPSSTYDLRSKNFGLGIDAYYYFYNNNNFHSYSGAGFTYNTVKRDNVQGFNLDGSPIIITTTTYQRQTSIFSGVQYSFNEYLSVFGEIGIEYLWGNYSDYNGNSLHTSKWNLANGGIGITFSF